MSTSKLRIERIDHRGGTLLRVAGAIDETLPRAELSENLAPVVVFDVAGIERITSFGVREWISLLKDLTANYVGFIHCRPNFVAQFNSVPAFGRRGELISMFLPYLCDDCGHEFDELLDLRQRFELVAADQPPHTKCPRCGKEAAFDDIAESYFSFVRQQGKPTLPDVATRMIAGKSEAPAAFRVYKEVEGAVTGLWLSGRLDARARIKRVLDGLQGAVVVEMSDVPAIDEDGASSLRAALEQGDAQPFFVRVPIDGVRTLFAKDTARLAGRVVSLVVEGECPTCQQVTRGEIDAVEIAGGKGAKARCEVCLDVLDVTPPEAELKLVAPLVCKKLPVDVSMYLEPRPLGYRPAVAGKSGSSSHSSSGKARPEVAGGAGRYEILGKIGRGGMAEIFLARQKGIEGFEKRVVLKRILAPLAGGEEFVEMFLQEAKVAARISHPNVVQIFDLGVDDGQYFIAMEYVHGWDLAAVLRAARRLERQVPLGVASRIVADVAAGLHAAHTVADASGELAPVVHRDVSPHNVLISTAGDVKITDFGISKVEDSSVRTSTGVVKGKVPYMAPEQLDESFGSNDHRIDIYQAGVVLAEVVLGYSPFRLNNDALSLKAVLDGALPRFSVVRPDLTPALEKILKKALALKPENRYGTAKELSMALETAIVEIDRRPTTAADVASWVSEVASSAGGERPGKESGTATGGVTEIVTPGRRH